MKKLGLDIGTVRIGVATSDPLGIIASAYEVYTRKFLKADVYHFADLAKTLECDTIVTGIIEWCQGGFILKVINNDFDDAGQYSISDLNTDTTSDVVVKGNIYDNKELLTQEYERID